MNTLTRPGSHARQETGKTSRPDSGDAGKQDTVVHDTDSQDTATSDNTAHDTGARQRADAALERLGLLHPKLIDLGLERTLALLEKLGDPQKQLAPVIHVAGTNAKGSVIALMRAMAEGAGLRVHTYVSPHLCRFNERIRLCGELIEDDSLAALLEEVEDMNDGTPITYFEITTAAAFLAFSRSPADLVLLETGLGGEFDSTNVVDDPAACVITPIARDHEHFLGSDIAGIAKAKAGIIKPGVPCISAAQARDVMNVLESTAQRQGAPLTQVGREITWHKGQDGRLWWWAAYREAVTCRRPPVGQCRTRFFRPVPGLSAVTHCKVHAGCCSRQMAGAFGKTP